MTMLVRNSAVKSVQIQLNMKNLPPWKIVC